MSYVNNNNSMSSSSNVGRYRVRFPPENALLSDWGPNPLTLYGSHGRTHTPGRKHVHVQRLYRTLRLILLLRLRSPPNSRSVRPFLGPPLWGLPPGHENGRMGQHKL